MTVVIVDYGVGNVASICNMLKKIGTQACVSSSISEIESAEKLVLPGIGAFDHAMERIESCGLLPVLTERVMGRRVPVLGICLGMQLFASRSAEGTRAGLNWIPGEIVRFAVPSGVKVPHMGWNNVRIASTNDLLYGFETEQPRFYFVHSFHWKPMPTLSAPGIAFHGYEFPAVISRENVLGVQFHPEKSHRFGMSLLRNFVERC